jgi:hypothetical protein
MSNASLLGVARPFQFKGQVYKVAVRDFFAELAFADWCTAECALALSRLRPHIPADFHAEQMRIYNSKLAGKQYAWGSLDIHNACFSEAGQRHLLFLKMKRGEEHGGAPVERELLDEIAKDKEKYAELERIMMEQDFSHLLEEEAKKKTTANQNPQASPAAAPDLTPKV